jgi:hypothetical protein
MERAPVMEADPSWKRTRHGPLESWKIDVQERGTTACSRSDTVASADLDMRVSLHAMLPIPRVRQRRGGGRRRRLNRMPCLAREARRVDLHAHAVGRGQTSGGAFLPPIHAEARARRALQRQQRRAPMREGARQVISSFNPFI